MDRFTPAGAMAERIIDRVSEFLLDGVLDGPLRGHAGHDQRRLHARAAPPIEHAEPARGVAV